MHISGVTHVTEFSARIVHYYECPEGNIISWAPAGNIIPYAPEGRHSLAQRVSAGSRCNPESPARDGIMAHSYSSNLVHCVFSTKGRVNLIPDERQDNLYAYLFGIAKNLKFEILAIGGIANHVHILLALPAAKTLSEVVRDLKANSSPWMREEDRRFGWQEGLRSLQRKRIASTRREGIHSKSSSASCKAHF